MLYIKKIIPQDIERTPTFSIEAINTFFKINLKNGESKTVDIILLGETRMVYPIEFKKRETRNEYRIFLNDLFNKIMPTQGDILILKKDKHNYTCEHISKNNSSFSHLNHLFQENSNHEVVINDPILNNTDINSVDSQPLNQILFGPPGTGKTDATIEKSLQILGKQSTNPNSSERRRENREMYQNLQNKRIFFVTMHPSYSYEDFVEGLKPKTSENGELTFEPRSGIFKKVATLARDMSEEDGETSVTSVSNDDILRICYFLSRFNSKKEKKANQYFGNKSNGVVFSKIADKFNLNPNSVKNHRDKFDFLANPERKGWTPRNGSSDKLDNTDLWRYNDIYTELKNKDYKEVLGIVKGIEEKETKESSEIEENINFVIILDEINRANISKVFGELITLLEEDKRIGGENELSVTLPSGNVFSVPNNLYVIGTMNTADKSIALVDIALRRRFEFIPYYPDSEVIQKFGSTDKESKIDLIKKLNSNLRDVKSNFYKGIDFQIGHSYFLKSNSLSDVVNKNIIPLLTEYFRNDLEKVRGLLEECGCPVDEDYYDETGLIKYG